MQVIKDLTINKYLVNYDKIITFSLQEYMKNSHLIKWTQPISILELLKNPNVPESKRIYLILRKRQKQYFPIYFGTNTRNTARFKSRIGELIADMFGFYSVKACHHSGGKSIHNYCCKGNIKPSRLFISWTKRHQNNLQLKEKYYIKNFPTECNKKGNKTGCITKIKFDNDRILPA